jgi:hypothetical protein
MRSPIKAAWDWLPRGEEKRKYRYKDFYVLVTFLNGRSDDEKYFHVNTKMAFSDRDIQLFLKMTSDGKDWQKSKELPIWTFGIASWKPKRPECAREAELGNNRPI